MFSLNRGRKLFEKYLKAFAGDIEMYPNAVAWARNRRVMDLLCFMEYILLFNSSTGKSINKYRQCFKTRKGAHIFSICIGKRIM